jgi:hypothetical protein
MFRHPCSPLGLVPVSGIRAPVVPNLPIFTANLNTCRYKAFPLQDLGMSPIPAVMQFLAAISGFCMTDLSIIHARYGRFGVTSRVHYS